MGLKRLKGFLLKLTLFNHLKLLDDSIKCSAGLVKNKCFYIFKCMRYLHRYVSYIKIG